VLGRWPPRQIHVGVRRARVPSSENVLQRLHYTSPGFHNHNLQVMHRLQFPSEVFQRLSTVSGNHELMSSVLSFLQEPSTVILQVLSCKISNEGLYVVEYYIRTSFRQAAVITAAFHYVFSASCAHKYLTTLPVEHWPNWIRNDHTVRRALKQLNIHFNQVNQKKLVQNFTLRVVVEFSPALAEEFTAWEQE
jgi:hypothetical protein